jgi:hypothetical protein
MIRVPIPMQGPTSRMMASHPNGKNLAEQGRQGNIKQNTTNQGYQQDR